MAPRNPRKRPGNARRGDQTPKSTTEAFPARLGAGRGRIAPPGTLVVLHVTQGERLYRFRTPDVRTLARARQITPALLTAGYTILVADHRGRYRRAKGFLLKTCAWIFGKHERPLGIVRATALAFPRTVGG